MPPLPQEVIDLIIDHIAAQALAPLSNVARPTHALRALSSCTLTSRAFSHRARQHIFKSIQISLSTGDARTRDLRDIMRRDPPICSYIREFTIWLSYARLPFVSQPGVESGLPDILEMLCEARDRSEGKGLQSLAISSIDWYPWAHVGDRFISALDKLIHGNELLDDKGQGQKSLQVLRISKFVGFPVSFLVRSAASLRELDIQDVSFMEIPEMLNIPLKQLSISGSEEQSYLLPERATSSLRRLTYVSTEAQEAHVMPVTLLLNPFLSKLSELAVTGFRSHVAYFGKIIELSAASLESLTFKLLPSSAPSPHDHCKLCLHKIASLRHLSLTIWLDDESISLSDSAFFLKFMSDTEIQNQLSASLEHFELTLRITTRNADQGYTSCFANQDIYHAINENLSNPDTFGRLRRVDLTMWIVYHTTAADESRVLEKIRQLLKRTLQGFYHDGRLKFHLKVKMEHSSLKF